MFLTDLSIELPNTFLPKVDRATMAVGVESRVPMLDENIVKLLISVNSSEKMKKNISKYL